MDLEAGDIHEREIKGLNSKSSRKFRFKQRHDVSSAKFPEDDRRGKHYRHRHHQHRHKRQKLSSDDNATRINSVSNMPQDQAFQESLFDALADDEGAAFWEGVYGQPIHSYPNTFVDSETGKVGTMNEEEYAQFVRQRMWEKSAEGVEAARQKRKRQRLQEEEAEVRRAREANKRSSRSRKPTEDADKAPYNNYHFDFELEASLRRGERRKEKKHWQSVWKDYTTRWDKLYEMFEHRQGVAADATQQTSLRNKIAWPVESGQLSDVDAQTVHRFVDSVVVALSESDTAFDTMSLIKAERVRWHPDKIQQRYGFMSIEKSTMEGVTAVFQILDQMLTNLRQTS